MGLKCDVAGPFPYIQIIHQRSILGLPGPCHSLCNPASSGEYHTFRNPPLLLRARDFHFTFRTLYRLNLTAAPDMTLYGVALPSLRQLSSKPYSKSLTTTSWGSGSLRHSGTDARSPIIIANSFRVGPSLMPNFF